MDTRIQQVEQQQDALMEQMRSIRVMRRGTLSEQYYTARCARKGGEGAVGPYFLWQGSINGKHFSRRVNASEAEHVKAGIEARHHFERLCAQYVELGEALAAHSQQNNESVEAIKKGLKSRSKRAKK